jgi:hypothetical protein
MIKEEAKMNKSMRQLHAQHHKVTLTQFNLVTNDGQLAKEA